MNPSRRWFWLVMAAGLAGCHADDLTIYKVPKEAPEAPSLEAAAAKGGGLAWSAPSAWTKKPGGGMRLASYAVPGSAGDGDLSIIVLPGEAGGDLANVNRWRGQIGLPPLAQEALAKNSASIASRAGPLHLVDFEGGVGHEGTRLLAAQLSVGSQTWFFKLTGKQATVAAAKPAFLIFIRSVRHE